MKNLLIAAVIAAALGFGGGYYVKSISETAARVAVAERTVELAGEAVKDNQESGERANVALAAVKERAVAVRKEISKHEIVYVEKPAGNQEPCSVGPLSVGAVRLLDAARRNEAPDASGEHDAESEAPSDITVAGFVENDLKVVEQYHDLAARHNELVDFIQKYIEETK